MKNKFVRFLLIINGILIPIFILFVLGNHFKNKFNSNDEFNELKVVETEYEIKQSSLIGIPNSENYLVAEYAKIIDDSEFVVEEIEEINLPYEVPKNTVNLIFLDKNFNQKRRLLKENASIKSMFISNAYSHNKDMIRKITHLSFYIAVEDSNGDGKIDRRDQHYVYVSDLNGENLIKVSDRKIKQYEWVNKNKELLLNFKTESSKPKYGLYNIENKILSETENITTNK
ncbi:hypothetical protein CXF68_01860 [Tenacibaculum sp. Bg11-29]|uniref:hypothetical protein n=1 Tax=Tenacibaculum sp. Bg11-29 TaxID=2058306 RepID=UPI000C33EB02|nr:hypothetical protein [Tenacibaculum sp. Bg11-29]PKH49508.1 hypothetical protein CXF68_01860 [Tenacibaculum sp. Bg11-29]